MDDQDSVPEYIERTGGGTEKQLLFYNCRLSKICYLLYSHSKIKSADKAHSAEKTACNEK